MTRLINSAPGTRRHDQYRAWSPRWALRQPDIVGQCMVNERDVYESGVTANSEDGPRVTYRGGGRQTYGRRSWGRCHDRVRPAIRRKVGGRHWSRSHRGWPPIGYSLW
jgi:hypothetical protein